MVEDLIRYMDYHQIASAPLIGHSMGGKTTMLLAVTHPERAERILVVDMAPKYYPVHHKVILDALSTLDFSQIKTREEADQQLGKFIIDVPIRQFLLKNVYRVTPDQTGLAYQLACTTRPCGRDRYSLAHRYHLLWRSTLYGRSQVQLCPCGGHGTDQATFPKATELL